MRAALTFAGGGALAGAAAQALEIAWVTDALPMRDAVAAMSLAAVLGAGCMLALFVPAWLAARLAGAGKRAGQGAWLLGAAAGTFTLFAAAGIAWRAVALEPVEGLTSATAVALVATLGAAAALGGFVARCLPDGLLRLADPGSRMLAIPGTLLLAGTWIAAAGTWPAPRPDPAPGPPAAAPGSVVVVVLDTQRADALSPYGAPAGSTPVVERLAAEGTVFEEVISPSPWTIPSHASLFTGLYPRSHGAWFGNRRWLDDGFSTLAERFADAGYDCAAFVSNGYLFLTNVLQGFAVTRAAFGQEDRLVLARLMRFTGVGFERWIDQGAAEAVVGVDAWLRERDPQRPFFLFVNLFEAHEAYHPPLADRRVDNLDAIRVTRRFESTRWHSLRIRKGPQADVVRSLYGSEVAYQDRLLGELLAVLGAHVRLDDLAIAVTSDHGENLGEDGRWGHIFALNDALLHVPLVIRAPGRMPAGERVAGAYQTLDVGPTLLALAGLDPSLGEGRSLLPDADGARQAREETFAEVYPDYFRLVRLSLPMQRGMGDFRWPMRAIRGGGEKLVVWDGGPSRLYDLSADPPEERDRTRERGDRARILRERLDAWSAARPALRAGPDGEGGTAPLDDETRRQLEALGYL